MKGAQDNLNKLKDGVLEFAGIEKTITDENNKQLDAKNNIVATQGKIKTGVEQLTEAEKKAQEEAKKLEETFFKIGESVRSDLVGNLREAINGSKTFGQAIGGVLNNLKNKLLDIALDKAISGIGGALSGGKGFGGFLGGLFGKRASGGPVSAGGAYLVGERGPEILQMGSKGGNIIPNSQLDGGGGTTNVVTVNVDAKGSSVAGSGSGADQLGQLIGGIVQQTLVREQRAGGLLNR